MSKKERKEQERLEAEAKEKARLEAEAKAKEEAEKERIEAEAKKALSSTVETKDSLDSILNKEHDTMAKEEKKGETENKEEEGKTIKMIWPHRKTTPGEIGKVFGHPAIANEEGFFVVDLPKAKYKNEMKRVQKLVPLELYNKRKELDKEAMDLY